MNNMNKTKKLVVSGLLLAVCLLLPFLTGQLQSIGRMLTPMHFPVLIAGFIVGPAYAAAIGFIAPLLRFVLFSMPPIFPTGLSMAFELCTYGLVAGLMMKMLKKIDLKNIVISLLLAMIAGRLVWTVVMFVILGFSGGTFTLPMAYTASILNSIPGIILQIIIIPPIILRLKKSL